ncbi:glutathione transferase GstA [Klebsiella aerogenes]|uniref:glutathione transferase GstA n=1 Tax=Klebsiella aerogenes TaxID=548 RepID=UPI000940BFD4|nr:glutathione transferase GstA [Klebsiella aerogenes]
MKNILAIQSHVVFGHAGNSAAEFPMRRLGANVWPLNTVQFSNHTQYGKWTGCVMPPSHLTEIVQGIADRVPDRQLLAPVGTIARYQTLEWLNYVATELHKGFTPLFRPDTPDDYKPTVRALLEKKLQYVDEALKDKQWLNGHRFTIADGYLFTVLRWGYAVKLNMEAYANIGAWMAHVAARPSVAAALSAEGLK